MENNYGKLFRLRRMELGLSQSEVAERAMCHRTTIGRIEQGDGMTLDLFLDLVRALEMKIDVVKNDGERRVEDANCN